MVAPPGPVCLVIPFGGAAKLLRCASAGRHSQHSHNPIRGAATDNTEPSAGCQHLSQNQDGDHRWELRGHKELQEVLC